MADSFVYIKDPKYQWVPARVVEQKGDIATVSVPQYADEQAIVSDGGKTSRRSNRVDVKVTEYANKVLPLQNVSKTGELAEIEDMVELPFLHEAAILYNLKARHNRNKPYTRSGDIVIAVNPYQWFHDIYTPQVRDHYSQKLVWDHSDHDARVDLEPHVYETSALSFKGLAIGGLNQSILVSGESGAGKTETVKICMNHIAQIQTGPGTHTQSKIDPIVQRVIDSNPLLEAFGNAKTRRNDNSSRFGKYLQLQFEQDESKMAFGERKAADCHLRGSNCEVYLLEKSRVVRHEQGERTFHIFYQLLAAPDEVKSQFWIELKGKKNSSFTYVGDTDTSSIEGLTDAEHFKKTIESLALVNVKGEKLDMLMKAICVVLQLGNIQFMGDADSSDISNLDEIYNLAELIGVPVERLTAAFTKRTLKTRGETLVVNLNAEFAKDSCDALAKEIYHKAFVWLVNEINESTKAENNNPGYTGGYGTIGLLDIFGFEHFKVNSFEQLCINYANEKLQQKFTEDIFTKLLEEYENEGLAMEDITYDDNTDVLDLIESRIGLLAMLNEECIRPKGSDKEFVFKAIKENKDSPALITSHRFDAVEFGVRHYASDVVYNASGFVTKNNDTLATDLQACAALSTNGIISGDGPIGFGGSAVESPKRRASPSSNIAAASVWTKYRSGLKHLMSSLRATQSRYIRCIKPNTLKEPRIMQHEPTLDQLRSAGVVAAITISRSAFPNRLFHKEVMDRFGSMWQGAKPAEDEEITIKIKMLLEQNLDHMSVEKDGRTIKPFAIGKTRTYFRAGALEFLESERIKGFEPAAITIQAVGRGFLVRKRRHNEYIIHRHAAITIQKLVRIVLAKAHFQKTKVIRQREAATRLKLAQEMRKKNKAATIINARARGVVRRKRFVNELREYREVTALKKEIAYLQEMVDQKEKEKFAAARAAEKRVKDAMEALKEEQTVFGDNEETERNANLILERANQLEKMRAENKKTRSTIKMMENRYKRLRDENKKLQHENDEVMKKFHETNQEAKAVNDENNDSLKNQDIWKKQIEAVGHELQRKKEAFMKTSAQRGKYQQTLADIIKALRTSCKDEQLIEDAIFTAFDCETEAKALRAAFESVQAQKAEREAKKLEKLAGNKKEFESKEIHMDEDISVGSLSDGDDFDHPIDDTSDIDEEGLDEDAAAMEAELAQLTAEVGV